MRSAAKLWPLKPVYIYEVKVCAYVQGVFLYNSAQQLCGAHRVWAKKHVCRITLAAPAGAGSVSPHADSVNTVDSWWLEVSLTGARLTTCVPKHTRRGLCQIWATVPQMKYWHGSPRSRLGSPSDYKASFCWSLRTGKLNANNKNSILIKIIKISQVKCKTQEQTDSPGTQGTQWVCHSTLWAIRLGELLLSMSQDCHTLTYWVFNT